MDLSPKAIRFLVEAVETQQAQLREKIDSGKLSEDAAADAGNDLRYYEEIKRDLRRSLATQEAR